MYYYKRKANPLKWIIIIAIVAAVSVFVYWFYLNYFSKINFFNDDNQDTAQTDDVSDLMNILLVNLQVVQGTVEVDLNNQGYESKTGNLAIHKADKIKTGPNARAILKFENGNVIRLSANTEIILEKSVLGEIAIKQLNGRTYHNVAKRGDYQVESLNTIVKALGAKFEYITNAQSKYLAVLSFSNKLSVAVNDNEGMITGGRIQANEKALIDLNADRNSIMKVEDFMTETLLNDDWYKWNFDQDLNQGEVAIEEEEEEPDFSLTNDSLILKAQLDEDKVSLSWTVFEGDDLKSYQLIKTNQEGELKYPEANVIKATSNEADLKFEDTSLEPDQTYRYRVCALKLNEKVVCGNVATIETEPKEEPDTIAPQGASLNISISVEGVSLSWNKNTEEDFKEYRVVKSLVSSAPVYPADGFIIVKTQGNESYLDNQVNITSPGTFYYRICSLDKWDNVGCSNVKVIENGHVK
jgi:FecR-like protein